jgi:drug/metabolite transporter (DMT)-like permease
VRVTAVLRGGLLALTAAVLFGASAPLVQRFGASLGPFATAALLYAGAAAAGGLLRRAPAAEAGLRAADIPRILMIAGAGAVVAPVALAWGLQHTSAISGSLVLSLEAVFTALLARIVYREHMGRRIVLALCLLTAGAAILAIDRGREGTAQVAGIAAMMLATFAWAVDNTLSRSLAERDPGQVVLVKGVLGAAATTTIAFAVREPSPVLAQALILLAVGATAYGLSLRFYLLAQRNFGAARTASVFSFAPFIGAVLAALLGDRSSGPLLGAAAALMLCGVVIHLREQHQHVHRHEAMDHEHAHTHDDLHHGHAHDPPVHGSHSHWHRHEELTHGHPHAPDAHHQHRH